MIIRKYTDGKSNLEIFVTKEKKLTFEIEDNGIYSTIELTYEDCYDLKDKLYDFTRQIEPAKDTK